MDLSAVMNDDDATPPRAEDADADNAETHRRKFEELARTYAAAEQDREELSARYAALTARLDRISTENEYLLSELSYYELSDLESDQSEIEFVTARKPKLEPSRAKRPAESAARKPKPKPRRPASAVAAQDEETGSGSAGPEPATKRKRPAPSSAKEKMVQSKKKPAATDE